MDLQVQEEQKQHKQCRPEDETPAPRPSHGARVGQSQGYAQAGWKKLENTYCLCL